MIAVALPGNLRALASGLASTAEQIIKAAGVQPAAIFTHLAKRQPATPQFARAGNEASAMSATELAADCLAPVLAKKGEFFVPGAGVTADFNGDGKTDLLHYSRPEKKVFWVEGNGDGTFKAPVSFAVQGNPTAI